MVNNKFVRRDLCDERSGHIFKKIDEIMKNHLPHLNKKINRMHEKIDKMQWLVITTLIAVIIGIVVRLATKGGV